MGDKLTKQSFKQKLANFYMMLDFESQYAQIFIFFITWGICFGIGYLFSGFTFSISFWISEIDELVSVEFKVRDILDLLLINLVYPLFAIKTRNLVKLDSITSNNQTPHKKTDTILTSKFTKSDYVYYFFLSVFIFGNTSHVLVNRISAMYRHMDYNNIFTELFHLTYFWDEYFGHLGIAIGIYGMAMLNFKKQIHLKCRKLRKDEWFWLWIFGIGFGPVFCGAMLEGQAVFPFLIFFISLLLIILVHIRKQRNKREEQKEKSITAWKLSDHPIIFFYILMAVGFIAAAIVFGFIYGMKPYYPFFVQFGGDVW
ncbi:MAG: hypothetical protein GF364_18720 [Candidatus Lokiarchaeota archaeon]|nr:hypothetical protein [Candidatus Lokiarchaeota archaeon]